MHEFTSISVSSYDAASLADRLTEKSAGGWDVVAIVPAGTNITAYLSRDAEAAEPAPSWDTGVAAPSEDEAAAEPELVAAVDDTAPIHSEETSGETSEESAEPELVADAADTLTTPTYGVDEIEESTPVWEPEPVAEEPAIVEEPAGWAVAPEPANSPSAGGDATPYLGTTTAGYETGTSSDVTPAADDDTAATPEPSTGYDTGATTEPSTGYDAGATADATEPSTGYDTGAADAGIAETSEAAVQPEPAADVAASSADEQATAAAASAAPAGWYADPSGRYELRYWDGNQWTEHVSRAGQQYTDPPVA